MDEPPGILDKIKGHNLEERDARKWFHNHTWNRSKVFNFLSHNTFTKPVQHPCNTVDGAKAGYPCTFPFYFPDCNLNKKSVLCKQNSRIKPKLYSECTTVGNSIRPWCSTRTYLNNSHIFGDFGYCSPNCTGGLLAIKSEEFNLASTAYDKLWEEGLYDLDMYGSGHCHTYNPEFTSLAGFKGQLYVLLGKFPG